MTHLLINPKCNLCLQQSSRTFIVFQKSILILTTVSLKMLLKMPKTQSGKLTSTSINLNTSSKPSSINHWHHCTQWIIWWRTTGSTMAFQQFFLMPEQIQLPLYPANSFRCQVNRWCQGMKEKQTLGNPAAMMEWGYEVSVPGHHILFQKIQWHIFKNNSAARESVRAQLQSAISGDMIAKIWPKRNFIYCIYCYCWNISSVALKKKKRLYQTCH